MAINDFAFDPVDGLKNVTSFPTTPENEAAARKQVQDVFDQITAYLNAEFKAKLIATTTDASGAHQVGSATISGVSGATVYAQLATLKTLIDGVALGDIPDGSLTNTKLATDIKVGSLATLTTTEKSSVAGAINEVDANADTNASNLTAHLADYEYQTATVVSRQIRLTKQSNTNILKFKLASAIANGTQITISLDGGTTSKPLQNFNGTPVTELDAGFAEVVVDATFFTLRPRGGANIKSMQRGALSFPNGVSVQTVTISPVATDISLVKITSYGTSDTANNTTYKVELTNTTTITISKETTSTIATIYWEVIEYNNVKSKQTGSLNLTTDLETLVGITSINKDKSILYATHSTTHSTSANAPQASRLLYSLENNQIALRTAANGYSAPVRWQVIEFK